VRARPGIQANAWLELETRLERIEDLPDPVVHARAHVEIHAAERRRERCATRRRGEPRVARVEDLELVLAQLERLERGGQETEPSLADQHRLTRGGAREPEHVGAMTIAPILIRDL
jgi:hypothetical protein